MIWLLLNIATWDPPERYTGEYYGILKIEMARPERVERKCRRLFDKHGRDWPTYKKQRGCAVTDGKTCWIISADRPVYGTTPTAILRHELGHCNGWEPHHPE